MQIDLKSMNRKELEKLLTDTNRALEDLKEQDRRDAIEAAEKAVAKFGFSLNDLTDSDGNGRKGKKSKAKSHGPKSDPQFVNPDNSEQTWTGKGRQPNWYREQVEAGTSPEAMKI